MKIVERNSPRHRRRLPVVMVRLKMSETLTEAATYIEQGHVRVGPHAVTDPAVRSLGQIWMPTYRLKYQGHSYH